jgi:hypothetical protein
MNVIRGAVEWIDNPSRRVIDAWPSLGGFAFFADEPMIRKATGEVVVYRLLRRMIRFGDEIGSPLLSHLESGSPTLQLLGAAAGSFLGSIQPIR